ncbi:MAG TPA: prolyl oligopeptidase family serine peptidase [Thermoanaerobaculia bacterium]|jgi:prolyl oligopeptidase|nr:prolyl oligopeptidase family serine peptidase [Thermoanaerobaculia bacterium]
MRAPAVAVLSLGAFALLAAAPAYVPAPVAEKRPVTDVYHGTKVVDDYRWLEDWNDPAVQAWSEAENAHARSVLDALPSVDKIRADVTRILKMTVVRHGGLEIAGGRLFAYRFQPPRQQPSLVVMPLPADVAHEKPVLDPLALDAEGGTSIDWYVPSPDGKKVAVSLSEHGSERGFLHVYDVDSGRELPDQVGRVYGGTAVGSAAWDGDGGGIFYTRYPKEGERAGDDLDLYTQVWHHRLGTPVADDRYEIGRDFPKIAEIDLQRSPDGKLILAHVQNGDGDEFRQFLRTADGRWTQVGDYGDGVKAVAFGADGALYGMTRKNAPRGRVLKLAIPTSGTPTTWAQAREIVPTSDAVIESSFIVKTLVPTKTALLVRDQVGGPQQVRVFDLDGKPRGTLPVPPVSTLREVAGSTDSDLVVFGTSSFTTPASYWQADATKPAEAARPTSLAQPWPLDFSDVEVVREEAVSKDGTHVPLSIVRKKGAPPRDGKAPTLLTGYGGYGVSTSPYFVPENRLWFDRGGVYAVANLRGGGEFGDDWHWGGALLKKQNVFDDFIACAEHLIKAGYTSPERLAIEGGSNGGLLMGAAFTQRPELFRAVVSHVGVYDMLRSELSPNGRFNVPEYGTVTDPAQFAALYAYSPYHHVEDRRTYPAILFLTGANDPRVDPMQSRKMTARLQAATGTRGTILLRTSSSSGHGIGTALDERIAQAVDVFAFLFKELAVAY